MAKLLHIPTGFVFLDCGQVTNVKVFLKCAEEKKLKRYYPYTCEMFQNQFNITLYDCDSSEFMLLE